MDIDGLYAELGLDFQPGDRNMFLQELADVARNYEAPLGPGERPEELGHFLEELAQEIGKEAFGFSPRLGVVPLNEKLFTDLHLEIPPYIGNLLQRFNFYLVDFPLTLLTRPGWGYTRLECRVEFNPGFPSVERPTAYQIFPHEEWQEVVRAWQGLRIGLDENLEFKADAAQAAQALSKLEAPVRGAVEFKVAGKAGLILGPFDYYIRRPKIRSQGRGNVKVIWRLEGEETIVQKQPRLGVVLQVPKQVSQVNIIGAAAAYRSFHVFSVAGLREVWNFLSKPSQSFFEKGAPVVDKKPWDDITAGI
ncbi:MAG: hypothetical protein PVG99_02375 [Desulfobacteraceae bacterium]|jgi:hypothetical protein